MVCFQTENWIIKDIKTVLFDKDGTFIDLHYFWGKMTEMRVNEIISRYNLKPEYFEVLCNRLGYDVKNKKMLSDGITALYSRSKIIELFLKDLKNYNLDLTKEDLEQIFDSVSNEFYINLTNYIKPIESAICFIKKLKNIGVKLGIVTADSVESTILTLKHLNLENYFDTVIGRESTPETKESGIPVKLAVKNLNANKNTTVMIGDAPTDSIAAKNAGINNSILVSSGQVSTQELFNYTDFAVTSLSEIETLC